MMKPANPFSLPVILSCLISSFTRLFCYTRYKSNILFLVYSAIPSSLPLSISAIPDTSLKDGLYHEYKKHGKVTLVKVVGLDLIGLLLFASKNLKMWKKHSKYRR